MQEGFTCLKILKKPLEPKLNGHLESFHLISTKLPMIPRMTTLMNCLTWLVLPRRLFQKQTAIKLEIRTDTNEVTNEVL